MQTNKLIDVLGDWSIGRGSLYGRLAEAIKVAIKHRLLREGENLPSERQLAASLSVSRSTVVAAYQQLKDENRIESRRGSATKVLALQRTNGTAMSIHNAHHQSLRLTFAHDATVLETGVRRLASAWSAYKP